MDWQQMVVVVAAIIAVCTLVMHYIPPKKVLDVEELTILNAKITVLEGQVKAEKESYSLASKWATFNASQIEKREEVIMKIFNSISDIVKNPTEVAALKTLVENLKVKVK